MKFLASNNGFFDDDSQKHQCILKHITTYKMTSFREQHQASLYIFFDWYKVWCMDDCWHLSYSELQVNYWVALLACLGMAKANTRTIFTSYQLSTTFQSNDQQIITETRLTNSQHQIKYVCFKASRRIDLIAWPSIYPQKPFPKHPS